MELKQLRTFVAVAQAGGFASAASALGVTASTVTRTIANLEASLDVKLFQRTTRSMSLTETGKTFLSRISPALEELDAAAEVALPKERELSGLLRVSASTSFGQAVIAPELAQFCARHPNLTIELLLSDERTDLVAERIDIAVRHGSLEDSSLIAQRLTRVQYHLAASPDYLASAAPINAPQDLINHPCLTYPYPAFRSRWQFRLDSKLHTIEISPSLRVSTAAALSSCAKSGMGIALLADWMIDPDVRAGTLVNLLPEWTISGEVFEPESSLWIITPSRSFVPAKTKAFADFLRRITKTQ